MRKRSAVFREEDLERCEPIPLGECLTDLLGHILRADHTALGDLAEALQCLQAEIRDRRDGSGYHDA